jgi:hypothetical protein
LTVAIVADVRLAMSFLVLAFGQVLVAAVIAATAWAAGSLADGALRRMQRTRRPGDTVAAPDEAPTPMPLPWALTMALGFAAVGQVLTLAGLMGMLRRPVVLAVIIVINIAAIPAWRRVLTAAAAAAFTVAMVVVVATALTAFFLTLYPPLGFDQTMYHLPQARAFAASGGLPFLPALRYPIFPPLAEVLNASVLMFAGDVATQATGWVALVACVGLAHRWARDLAGDVITGEGSEASSRASGSLAAAAILGSPIALYLAATGYVEPLLALLGGASLYAADRTRAGARITTDARWLVAAGVLAGSAASVKYLGLYFVPAAAMLILADRSSTAQRSGLATPSAPALAMPLSRAPRRVMPRALVIFGVAAIAAMLACYGRLLAHTGNPVFPFYPELFGANPWGSQVIMGPSGAERWSLTLTRLWDVTFRREAVGGLPHFSPAFVFGVPIILLAAWRHHRFRLLLLIAVGYLLAAPTHAHYLFTIAVLWSALAAASAAVLLRSKAGVMIAMAVILACGGEAYAVYRLYRLGLPPATSEARAQLIASQRPLYPAIAWLNRHAGPVTLYAVDAELMVDYASGTLLGDYNGPASFDRMEARVRATGSIAAALDAIGASHLLVPAHDSFWKTEASRDPRLTRIYDDRYAVVYRVK